jgi:hypothetical protein
MTRTNFLPLAVPMLSVLFVVVGGCAIGTGDPRTSNQGGGNLLSAGIKVTSYQLSALTPDELQILADQVAPTDPNVPQLTDEQADAIVQILRANNINSLDDLNALIAQAQTDPSVVVLPEGLSIEVLAALFGSAA